MIKWMYLFEIDYKKKFIFILRYKITKGRCDLMKVIGRRSNGVGILFMLMLLLSMIMIFIGIYENYFLFMGFVLFVVSLYIVIDYHKTPKAPIMTNDKDVVLHQGIIIRPNELVDVSYKRASARGFQYRFGTVIIQTTAATYKFRYLKDCEKVSKELSKLMYQNK